MQPHAHADAHVLTGSVLVLGLHLQRYPVRADVAYSG